MKQKSIAGVLKFFTALAAVMAGLFFFWYVPIGIEEIAITEHLEYMRWPGTLGMWAIALMVYLALFDFWKICGRIGKEDSFCRENASAMTRIGIYALMVFALILGGALVVSFMNLMDGPFALVVFFVEFVAAGIAVICLCLGQLILRATEIKEENELTI